MSITVQECSPNDPSFGARAGSTGLVSYTNLFETLLCQIDPILSESNNLDVFRTSEINIGIFSTNFHIFLFHITLQ